MAEYIDREALFAEFDRLGLGEHSIVEKVFSIGVRTIIAGMPAADVAQVVRCKDCKRWDDDPDTYGKDDGPRGKCMKSFEITEQEDFCSYGERKDGETDGC